MPGGDAPRFADGEALQLLGIARRAGRVVAGADSIRSVCRRGEAVLAVVAGDAGENARGRVLPEFRGRGVRVVECGTRRSLGRAIGRGPTPVLVLTDRGLADAFLERLAKPGEGDEETAPA